MDFDPYRYLQVTTVAELTGYNPAAAGYSMMGYSTMVEVVPDPLAGLPTRLANQLMRVGFTTRAKVARAFRTGELLWVRGLGPQRLAMIAAWLERGAA